MYMYARMRQTDHWRESKLKQKKTTMYKEKANEGGKHTDDKLRTRHTKTRESLHNFCTHFFSDVMLERMTSSSRAMHFSWTPVSLSVTIGSVPSSHRLGRERAKRQITHSTRQARILQWNLSNTDTLGPIKWVLIRDVSSFQEANNSYFT